jgi:hypothetical protein
MRWVPFLTGIAFVASFAAQPQPQSVRGKVVHRGEKAAIETADHKVIFPEGEPETMAVLGDKRLAGLDLELLGRFDGPDRFVVGPFYTSKSMIVHKDGKRYTISYWCPVCSIRTYTPGKCMCCQQETHLALEELKP